MPWELGDFCHQRDSLKWNKTLELSKIKVNFVEKGKSNILQNGHD
jgi:hypothetical protein